MQAYDKHAQLHVHLCRLDEKAKCPIRLAIVNLEESVVLKVSKIRVKMQAS